MNIHATYQQIQDFIKDKIKQDISLSYIDETTIQVRKTIKMLMMQKDIALAVRMTDLEDQRLTLTIAEGAPAMIVSKLIDFLSRLDFIFADAQSRRIVIDLDKVDLLQPVLNRASIEQIQISPEGIALELHAAS